MHNEGNKQATISELPKILVIARDIKRDKDKEFTYADNNILIVTSRILNPKVPGQDTPMYNK